MTEQTNLFDVAPADDGESLTLATFAERAYLDRVATRIAATWDGVVNTALCDGLIVTALHDYALWREASTTLEHMGAGRRLSANLITGDGRAEPARGVEVTASTFRMIPARPLLGRTLTDADDASDSDGGPGGGSATGPGMVVGCVGPQSFA